MSVKVMSGVPGHPQLRRRIAPNLAGIPSTERDRMPACKAALLIALVAAAGCHRTPAAVAPAPSEDLAARTRADSIEAAERARADSLAMARRAEADRLAREAAERLARARAAMRDTLAERVYFDFDRSDLRPEGRSAIDRKVAILQGNPSLRLQIAGNADERGSDEYNLALGNRRAATVRAYLLNHGIAADRLEVLSYGEEQPLVVGHDESAWAMNRRDDFTPTMGADSLAQPQAMH
jgi:peptidoglycan-associated lipoprotein